MIAIVKMDEKGRIQIPHEVRELWKLKPKQPLVVEMKAGHMLLKIAGRSSPENDPLLRDILINPARSKVKVTKKLLRKLEEEQWSG